MSLTTANHVKVFLQCPKTLSFVLSTSFHSLIFSFNHTFVYLGQMYVRDQPSVLSCLNPLPQLMSFSLLTHALQASVQFFWGVC